MTDLKSLTLIELQEFLKELNEPAFRAKQIFKWLHEGVTDFDEMTNISKETRKKLREKSYISKLETEVKLVSKIDGTVKYLFRLDDGNAIETVVMRYNHGLSVCISSQVGCRMGCGFCASTLGGLCRNLTGGEILNQVIFAQKDLKERISNIVMMGIGEPFDNFENVMTFLKNVNDPNGLNIGYRHISISTCGLVPKIYEMAETGYPINLCISLHAPSDETRSKIMPINKKYGIDELIKACKDYTSKTSRRITFEYSLISGVNDNLKDAEKLAKLLRGMLCHVNLIPVNYVSERGFRHGSKKSIYEFCERLNSLKINATIRRELGSDINASCGQLRRKMQKDEEGDKENGILRTDRCGETSES